jgi:hypothetical protein
VTKKNVAATPESKRTRDIRNGVLLAHVVLSWVVVAAVRFKWWTVLVKGENVGEFFGTDEHAFQTGYITLAALVCFFFTSYDIVANADIQWPPLLASAFALGCAAEVTWKLNAEKDVVLQHVISAQLSRDMAREHERERGIAALDSSSIATLTSDGVIGGPKPPKDESIRVRLGPGLLTTLFGTFSMVLLSSYLTFLARREGS